MAYIYVNADQIEIEINIEIEIKITEIQYIDICFLIQYKVTQALFVIRFVSFIMMPTLCFSCYITLLYILVFYPNAADADICYNHCNQRVFSLCIGICENGHTGTNNREIGRRNRTQGEGMETDRQQCIHTCKQCSTGCHTLSRFNCTILCAHEATKANCWDICMKSSLNYTTVECLQKCEVVDCTDGHKCEVDHGADGVDDCSGEISTARDVTFAILWLPFICYSAALCFISLKCLLYMFLVMYIISLVLFGRLAVKNCDGWGMNSIILWLHPFVVIAIIAIVRCYRNTNADDKIDTVTIPDSIVYPPSCNNINNPNPDETGQPLMQ
jgi:hypothetical protein